MSEAKNNNPKWLIDTHGIHEALTTRKNSIKDAVISAIEDGSMLVTKKTSKEIKEMYPELYNEFKDIKNKKYLTLQHSHVANATVMMQGYGSNIIGGIPSVDCFELLSSGKIENLTCVTSGKSLNHCIKIASKLGTKPPLSLENFEL
ncbi:hypothetical protein [Thalassospira povalilytica]|uniref:Uncharacterized protein n=1 Tax=Thalassospira povalilytica TaxID=732237 RepID=A0A8I1SKX3_9PROT|nr:hypothetical protein [Thalassospira povalilytica]MBN8197861.1 hypothetical protein [Thalassospira povalilytica]